MTFKRILFLMLGLSFLVSACIPGVVAPTPTPTVTLRPTRTATLVPSPWPTFTPAPPLIFIATTANCFAGPGPEYDVVTVILINPDEDTEGYPTYLLGTSGSYWLIAAPDGTPCWIQQQYDLGNLLTGNMDTVNMPTLTPMPTATLTTPTAAPPAVENLYLKKKKCSLQKVDKPYTRYVVNITFLLEWQDVPGEDGYILYRDGNPVGEIQANTTIFSDTFEMKKPGRTSTYYIVAYNVLGETRSALFSFANPC